MSDTKVVDPLFDAFYRFLRRSGVYMPTNFLEIHVINQKLVDGCRYCRTRVRVHFYLAYDYIDGWPILNAGCTNIVCKKCAKSMKFVNFVPDVDDEDVELFISVLKHAQPVC